jgi:drug/metabolite transporter (DMT)-like permease
MIEKFAHIGEISAFISAILWAFGVILYKKSGESLHPITLNIFKISLSLILFIPFLIIFKIPILPSLSPYEYLIFFISGLLGIALGDTLFFKSLNCIGAGLSAIIDCLYSPSIILISLLWLKENLTILQIIGVVLIISGILFTANFKHKENKLTGNLIVGVILGIIAILVMAVSVVMMKPLLNKVSIIWIIIVRFAGALIGLLIILPFISYSNKIIEQFYSSKGIIYTFSGSLIGQYLSVIFWIAGFKYTQASIASAINQTSNIFIFIFASIFLKEPFTIRKLIAFLLGISGAFIVGFA